MSYRNKTYVAFDADNDMWAYRLMTAWHANEGIDFGIFDAHNINNIWAQSQEATIKRRLRERLNNTKQMVVLVGESTKNLYTYVRWEIEVAIGMDIPIIAANLDKAVGSTSKTPPILKNEAYFLNVPFGPKKIKYALDHFPAAYEKHKHEAPSSRVYDWSKITL